jgi:hypothetical protein
LWECGFREAESKALWEVWVPQSGIHAFHNAVISTKSFRVLFKMDLPPPTEIGLNEV